MSDTEREIQELYGMTAQRYFNEQDEKSIPSSIITLIALLTPLFTLIAAVAGIIYYACLR